MRYSLSKYSAKRVKKQFTRSYSRLRDRPLSTLSDEEFRYIVKALLGDSNDRESE